MVEERGERVNELCRCYHLKSRHMGINGHGMCMYVNCECGQYTFAGWVYKKTLSLRSGDDILQELSKTLKLEGKDYQKIFIVNVDVLKIAEFNVTVGVNYAYGQ